MPRVQRGRPEYRALRQRLRSQMTAAERQLWGKIRSRQLRGFKFRRQHGIGPYIVDFYCPELALVVEVDGDSHATDAQAEKDGLREAYLRALGVRVIRYNNLDVLHNLSGLLEDLAARLTATSLQPPRTPP